MVTSDPSVSRARPILHHLLRYRAQLSARQQRAHVGAALGSKRKQVVLSTKTEARDKAGALAQLGHQPERAQDGFRDIWYLTQEQPGRDS